MKIKINNIEYEANLGETILDICRREGIRIPTLCAHGKLKREAVCRLCLVETNRSEKLVTSCSFQVCEGLEVVTESERIKKAREINMELLWSDHAGKCVSCKKNRRCELQKLAEEYKIENFHFVPRKEEMTKKEELDLIKDNRTRVVVDDKNPVIHRTTEFCVECRRCINICPVKSYGFNNRAGDVVVGTPYNQTLDCLFCGACVKHCPTAALSDKNGLDKVIEDINNLNLLSVAIIDPVVMASIQYEFPEIDSMPKLIGLLKKIGFEKIVALEWGMGKYMEKLAQEVFPQENFFKKIVNKKKRVKINSNCPAFTKYVQKYYPDLKNNIVDISIPEEIMAEAIREEYAQMEKINQESFSISVISSCVAKKTEKTNNINYFLTVRELGRLARKKCVDGHNIIESNFDKFISKYDNNFAKMTVAGGTLALLQEKIGDGDASMIAVNSMMEAKKVLDSVARREANYDFIEMMICPGGCGHGGGQAINQNH